MAGTATPTPTERSQARLQRSDRAEEWLAGSDLQPIPAESPIPPHDDAVGRLERALAEQGRRRRQYEAAFETSDERNAYVRLCEANERVATRARWLEWVDQHWDRGRSTALSEEDEMTAGKRSQPAARRRGELHRADGNRQVGHAIGAASRMTREMRRRGRA